MWNSSTTFAGSGSSLTYRMKSNSRPNYYLKTCFVLWTLSNDLVIGTEHAPGKALCSTHSGLMLDKQITNAYAAIDLAMEKDKLHAQFEINA